MAGKERGIIQIVFKYFIASITPNLRRKKLIGEDFYGTRYFEESLRSTSTRQRPARSFVPVNKDDHTQEMPAEWESWLRYRRKHPPTKEEIEENYKLALMKKENAAEIESTYAKPVEISDASKVQRGMDSFPSYEEYKDKGSNYSTKKY